MDIETNSPDVSRQIIACEITLKLTQGLTVDPKEGEKVEKIPDQERVFIETYTRLYRGMLAAEGTESKGSSERTTSAVKESKKK